MCVGEKNGWWDHGAWLRDGMVLLFWITNSFGEQTLALETTRLGLPPRTDNSMDIVDAQLLILLVYSRDPLQSPKHKFIEFQ